MTLTDFLDIVLADNFLVYLEVWSIVHLLSGLALMALLIAFYKKRGSPRLFAALIGLLLIWEAFELVLYTNGLIRAESMLDFIWDIISGALGGLLYWVWWRCARGESARSDRWC